MDQVKTGALIKRFRTQMGLTQRQLAGRIGVSDKAVSKWERGNGCPDVSLLAALAETFSTEVGVLLTGELDKKEKDRGSMKHLRFYLCKECGNVVAAASGAAVVCCGARLAAETPVRAEADEMLKTEETGGELFVSSDREMTKRDYVPFVAYVGDSVFILCRQYPEWGLQAHLPVFRSGRLVWYSPGRGLLYQELQSPSRPRGNARK